jgi:thioredoxin-like negative regulator of GroEL
MAIAASATRAPTRGATVVPRLVFFHSSVSGRCRRVEGFIAQVLQRRQNHETFIYLRVPQEDYPEMFERFGIDELPTLVVIEDNAVRGQLATPRSCREIERFLAPWLK